MLGLSRRSPACCAATGGHLAALSSSPIAPLLAPPPPCEPSHRRPLPTAKIYETRPKSPVQPFGTAAGGALLPPGRPATLRAPASRRPAAQHWTSAGYAAGD